MSLLSRTETSLTVQIVRPIFPLSEFLMYPWRGTRPFTTTIDGFVGHETGFPGPLCDIQNLFSHCLWVRINVKSFYLHRHKISYFTTSCFDLHVTGQSSDNSVKSTLSNLTDLVYYRSLCFFLSDTLCIPSPWLSWNLPNTFLTPFTALFSHQCLLRV